MTQGDLERLSGVHQGDLLAGKYRVECVLGVGGMGVVVAARHLQLDTKVAIKFLLPAMLANQEAVGRFAWEARNAARITSEHVARVFDVGTLENGAPYMVMEYLDGVDVAGWLRQRGPLPFEEAIDFVLQAGEAIAEAHVLGIVHRDLKPANLFCIRSADGRLSIKVLDFGISKVTNLSASASNLIRTQTATLMGSPFYMSPEQMEATHAVDARTDIWALGVILFELLTGKVPFYGETVPEVSLKIGLRAPPPLRDFRPDAPESLQAVVLRCLEKDRERRYRNMAELALALLPFGPKRARASVEKIAAIIQGAGLSATALSVPPSSEPTDQPPSSETMAPLGRTAQATKGGKTALGIFTGVGVMAVVGGVAGMRHLFTDPQKTDAGQGISLPLPMADAAGETAIVEAAAAESCVLDSMRCNGTTPATCNAGRWVDGVVTAGQCGAVCSPGSSPPKCSGDTPQVCTSIGQWENRGACPSGCSEGACVARLACNPGRKQCSSADEVRTCGAQGQWEPPTLCPSHSCRDGRCTTPPPDCDPNYTFDDQGRKHFKPECFASPSR